MSEDKRERIHLATKKDFDVSYFCGSGAGGQARNKVASGVQIIHRESGAIGRASDSRSQADNKKSAFQRLLGTAKFKFWLSKKLYEIREKESLEETVFNETTPENLKFEIKNSEGKWEEVSASYFDSPAAKEE
jgi:protein subunit release factor B